jgi:long-subunit acyl-CoA synthetase (AMP-forming)
MNFLENILSGLQAAGGRVVLAEAQLGGDRTATGSDLSGQIALARTFLRSSGLAMGDRCALIAPNSIRWAALDLAIIAEGLIAVPLYARQAPEELATMLRDAGPGLICCGDAALRDAIAALWPDAPRFILFDEIFSANPRIGFLAAANAQAAQIAAGKIAADKIVEAQRGVFNQRLDAAVTAVLAVMILVLLGEAVVQWYIILRRKKEPVLYETPYIATQWAEGD